MINCKEVLLTLKVLVVVSGGVDSGVCLAHSVRKYGAEDVKVISFSYGQRNVIDLEFVKKLADFYGVDAIFKDLTTVFESSDCALIAGSSLSVPHSTYSEQVGGKKGAPIDTFVPFRNGVFYTAAAAIAMIKNCNSLVISLNGDSTMSNAYPDASHYFFTLISDSIYVGTGGRVEVLAPFLSKSKADIVRYGEELSVPFELTYSCYEGDVKPCGKCAGCLTRLEAFSKVGSTDPLVYKR